MYEVMIIDDDDVIRDYLKEMIDWTALDLHLACETGDGDTAQDLFLLYKPKIVIVDIRILDISGLDLAKDFLRQDPDLRVIVITSFTDFEYARTALSLGASDLLSKPISPEDINASLKKAIRFYEQKKKEHLSANAVEHLMSKNIKILQERQVSLLMHSTEQESEERIREQLRILSLDLEGAFYAVFMIVFDTSVDSGIDKKVRPVVIKNYTETRLKEHHYKNFALFDDNWNLCCLISWTAEDGIERAETLLVKLHEEMEFYFKQRIFAGIGSPVRSLSQIRLSARQAAVSLKYRGILESGAVVNYKNIQSVAVDAEFDKEDLLRRLSEQIRLRQFDDVRNLFERWFRDGAVNEIPLANLREFSLEYISILASECRHLGIHPWNAIDYPTLMSKIFLVPDPLRLKKIVIVLTEKILQMIGQKESENKNKLIVSAKLYIKEHLSDENLNLDAVSNHVNLSKIYFCTLFHKEENIGFNNYLILERVKYAKRLLAETDLKVAEIGVRVGYGRQRYFNYVFKRTAGMSPLEYRKNLLENAKA